MQPYQNPGLKAWSNRLFASIKYLYGCGRHCSMITFSVYTNIPTSLVKGRKKVNSLLLIARCRLQVVHAFFDTNRWRVCELVIRSILNPQSPRSAELKRGSELNTGNRGVVIFSRIQCDCNVDKECITNSCWTLSVSWYLKQVNQILNNPMRP